MSGIFGAYSLTGGNVSEELLLGTVAMQHRGEEGCGVSFGMNGGFLTRASTNSAYDFFNSRFGDPENKQTALDGLNLLSPDNGISHTLYESTGDLQPRVGREGNLALAMDGNLLGFDEPSDFIMRKKFSSALKDSGDVYKAVRRVMEELEGKGSYCVVALVKEKDNTKLVAFRDPKGIKPYGVAMKGDVVIVGSESKAADAIEAEDFRDLKAGEAIVASRSNGEGYHSEVLFNETPAHCCFEWIYFADPTSVIEGKNVYQVRKSLGAALANRYAERLGDLDLVMASPDSGRGVAIGFQQELSKLLKRFVPYDEAAIKNSGARRTFQVEDPAIRNLAARVKFYVNEDVVKGKLVAVGDDSIVRGTVFRDGMIYKLNRAGAKGVIPVISCPPLLFACIKDLGGKDFIARGMQGGIDSIGEQVAEKIGADFVCYPTMRDMKESIGLEEVLCSGCLDGQFPVQDRFWK